jgi:hypothetical protein
MREDGVTEAQWLTCTDPRLMLEWLRGKVSDRKLRLFACACCRRIWHLLEDSRSREAIEVSEQFADGMAREAEVQAAYARAWEAAEAIPDGTSDSRLAAEAAAYAVLLPAKRGGWDQGSDQLYLANHVAEGVRLLLHLLPGADEFLAHCNLLRDLFSNPYRPAVLSSAWLTAVVLSLAHAANDNRITSSGELDPSRFAVLADALQEAGCTDDAVIDHLRSPGPHVRGCWVLDQLLKKE